MGRRTRGIDPPFSPRLGRLVEVAPRWQLTGGSSGGGAAEKVEREGLVGEVYGGEEAKDGAFYRRER